MCFGLHYPTKRVQSVSVSVSVKPCILTTSTLCEKKTTTGRKLFWIHDLFLNKTFCQKSRSLFEVVFLCLMRQLLTNFHLFRQNVYFFFFNIHTYCISYHFCKFFNQNANPLFWVLKSQKKTDLFYFI